ncbi:MAG: YifB family Mg chelatase-like AAA ATPase [Halieaceae bacterium]|nr:YifB family Mg chelatase-like AAA ATPase [Halieaceae bacterium]
MQLSVIKARALVGIDAPLVRVETHLSSGLPGFNLVGMPETTVRESKDRVRSAIINSHFDFPDAKITVNLAPADLPKEGGRFDLAIALGVLAASGQINTKFLSQYEFLGELGLDGALHPVTGVLASAHACAASDCKLMVSHACAPHAAQVPNCFVMGAESLLDVCAQLRNAKPIRTLSHYPEPRPIEQRDLTDVRGQLEAKRALEIAAAGGHNVFLYGPPGTGKTLLASRLAGLLPPLSTSELLEVRLIQDLMSSGNSSNERPFRAPHHSASAVALVGGGSKPKPGEITLAHRGILFLDEIAEFPRATLDMLREPLESGSVRINRAKASVTYPANFQLIAAANPCPCGYLGDPDRRCRCSNDQIERYQARLSGPLLDRIDLFCRVERLDAKTLLEKGSRAEKSAAVAARVSAAQASAYQRQSTLNASAHGETLANTYCSDAAKQTLTLAADKFQLSGRSVHRALRVARTIADLANADSIERNHMLEALSYRQINFNKGAF